MDILAISKNQHSLVSTALTRLESRIDSIESILLPRNPYILRRGTTIGSKISASQASHTGTSMVHIHASLRQQCARYCACQCHSTSSVRTPSWAQTIIGSMVLRYNGAVTVGGNICNKQDCLSGSSRSVRVGCTFPKWLLATCAVSLSASWGSPTNVGASLYITVPRYTELSWVGPAIQDPDVASSENESCVWTCCPQT